MLEPFLIILALGFGVIFTVCKPKKSINFIAYFCGGIDMLILVFLVGWISLNTLFLVIFQNALVETVAMFFLPQVWLVAVIMLSISSILFLITGEFNEDKTSKTSYEDILEIILDEAELEFKNTTNISRKEYSRFEKKLRKYYPEFNNNPWRSGKAFQRVSEIYNVETWTNKLDEWNKEQEAKNEAARIKFEAQLASYGKAGTYTPKVLHIFLASVITIFILSSIVWIAGSFGEPTPGQAEGLGDFIGMQIFMNVVLTLPLTGLQWMSIKSRNHISK